MINIAEAFRAHLRAELSIDRSDSVPALHLRLVYGGVTICDAEVDLPAPAPAAAAPDRAAERRQSEADMIAEARAFADAQGRAVALGTLALADARAEARAEIRRLQDHIIALECALRDEKLRTAARAIREGGP